MSEKKLYAIGTYTEKDWDAVHEILTRDGTLEDNIPSRSVECVDLKEHSPTRSVYLLTDEEAAELSKHPSVKFVNLDYPNYPEKFRPPPEELQNIYRYSASTKQYRNFNDTNLLPASPTESDLNRGGYQLLRCAQKNDPWYGIPDTTIINSKVDYANDGTDVDVIVGDDGCWFGHVEFQNNATGIGPIRYVGGNVLPGNGTCDLLDLCLDAPYYLDPEWFDADPSNRLTTRWDGTIVPVESVARAWWSNSSQRSSKFASAGTVIITSGYTRSYCNGSNTAISSVGQHGTCCAALTYGRTQGWAFNANKWFVNVYNTNGTDIEQYFDMMKIFHVNKPINPKYGNKNPTISSNSWGYRAVPPSSGYAYYRGDTVGIQYTSDSNKPGFMRYVGDYGDAGRMKGEMIDNSYTEAGAEMIAAGVIFVGAAGNSNQKQVGPTHPDFNNYFNSGPNQLVTDNIWEEFGIRKLPYTNRRGFPQHIGKTAEYVYPVINIGALDDSYTVDGKERKVNYSDMGEEIDCYAPADGTLAANHSYTAAGTRYDTYPGVPSVGGVYGVYTSSAQVSGTSNFIPAANTGHRIISTGATSATYSSIASSLLGAASLTASTTPTSGNTDDGFWNLTLPFNITFLNNSYNQIYIGTNSYITFGGGSSSYSGLGQGNPALPKIMISAADNSGQRIYYGTEGTAPNRTFRVRFEGTAATGGTVGSPNMVYEAVFYEATPAQIDIQIGVNNRKGIVFTDAKFSGTSAACPVATGLIATVLQTNRTWGWQEIRAWLRSDVSLQDTSRFYTGVESTSANAASWSDVNSLEGGAARVIYNTLVFRNGPQRVMNGSGIRMKGAMQIRMKN